jgi:hypothetical protein
VGDVTGEFEVKALYAKKTPYFVVAELYHKGCFESFSVPLVAGFEFNCNCTYTDPAFTVRNRRYRIAQVLPLKIEEAIP